MKGAFGIEVIRNGRKLKLDVNNRVLKSGLDFQYKYSVDNNSDSIITHLMFGGAHSTVDISTTGMSDTPLVAIPYIDYITPDFEDEDADIFINKLVFKLEATESMVIKQLATGRINTTSTNDGGTVQTYDYFSLANILDSNNEPTELVIYPGDIVTITYSITFMMESGLGSYTRIRREDIPWNIVRANPNWQLCGILRKIEIIKAVMWEYWGLEFTPQLRSQDINVQSNVNIARNVTIWWNLNNEPKANIEANPTKYKRYIDIGGTVPNWSIANGLYFANNNGIDYLISYTNWVHQLGNVSLDMFHPDGVGKDVQPEIISFTKEFVTNPITATNSYYEFVLKSTPLSVVYIIHGDNIINFNMIGGGVDLQYGSKLYTDANGILKVRFDRNTYIDNNFKGDPIRAIVFTRLGSAISAPLQIPFPEPKIIGYYRGVEFTPDYDNLIPKISIEGFTNVNNNSSNFYVKLLKQDETWQGSEYDTFNYINGANNRLVFQSPNWINKPVDDGTWVLHIKATPEDMLSYEIPLINPVPYPTNPTATTTIVGGSYSSAGIPDNLFHNLTGDRIVAKVNIKKL